MTGSEEVVFFRMQDDRGTRVMTVARTNGGGLRIGGQDLGSSVAVFGADFREYEWDWDIDGADVVRAIRLLGGTTDDDDIVPLLTRWTEANGGRDPGQFLKDGGLEMRFWSRVGE